MDPNQSPEHRPALLGQVFANPTVPTTTGKFFACRPARLTGTESEGATGALDVDGSRIVQVFVVGPSVPVAGDFLLARFTGHRWVSDCPGQAGTPPPVVTLPPCPCASIPLNLTMTSTRPESNNQLFQNATFTYQAVPAGLLPLGIGPNAFLSNESFPDHGASDLFRYFLTCVAGFYSLTRVFETSIYGSPYRDTVLYRWLIGVSGNTCSPFALTNGEIFAGGDPSVVVAITG